MTRPMREESSLNRIRAIFYSGTHTFTAPEVLVHEIAFLVDEDYLQTQEVQIASKEGYLRAVDKISFNGDYDADGGGNAHIALKRMAADYILRTYNANARFEVRLCGYVPDVVSTDTRIVAECGHTNNPDKMLAYFRHGNISTCIQVPYPDVHDTNVRAHVFTARSDLRRFLNAVQKDRLANVKALIIGRK